jgi:hypothetical protein
MNEYYIDTNCKYVEAYEPDHTYTFTGPCIVTGKSHSVTIEGDDLWTIRSKGINRSRLSADDREFVMSGTSPEGWDILFED